MKNWRDILVSPEESILKVIEIIDKGGLQLALVTDEQHHLLGTVSDGDIRRGILKGVDLHSPVEAIMNKKPLTVKSNDNTDLVLHIMHNSRLRQIPVVNDEGQIIALEILENLINFKDKENYVLLMAGGLGTRLKPLTDEFPKPLLKVGDKPIIQTIIENFIEHGFKKFIISVNYKGHLIEEFLGDGKRFGVTIEYLHEDKRMGTAGSISLIEQQFTNPLIVMNSDVLTKINFTHLIDFHLNHNALATMCVRQYDYTVPYGVVVAEEYELKGIIEKPSYQYFVNAGIYVLAPEAMNYIPKDTFFDMPDLFEKIVQENKRAIVFPIREYWLDIGQLPDFHRANEDYNQIFNV